ncbi:putative transposase [Duganella sp. 1224]|uniref:transposase n=1 Tax=Duganella sp. 1224 TaxID=2587052 RepID=UPI0015CC4BA1|nr:transposase [Duganella sp. 1224]NYE61340.1 putative transposase [Duganella sp. 1224]
MPRQSRVVLPAVPLHVIQRGHDRQRCFFMDDDYVVYRQWLHEAAVLAETHVHAYVLMSNHVHLLMSVADAAGLAGMMKELAQRYAQYLNYRHGTSGTVWDGRYKSCLVQTEGYLLTCQRYIEMNPVRAGMVRFPGNYKWSSYRCNAEGRHDEVVTPHSVYERLGTGASARRQAYLRLFLETLTPQQLEQIRAAGNGNGVLGDRAFIAQHRRRTPQP